MKLYYYNMFTSMSHNVTDQGNYRSPYMSAQKVKNFTRAIIEVPRCLRLCLRKLQTRAIVEVPSPISEI